MPRSASPLSRRPSGSCRNSSATSSRAWTRPIRRTRREDRPSRLCLRRWTRVPRRWGHCRCPCRHRFRLRCRCRCRLRLAAACLRRYRCRRWVRTACCRGARWCPRRRPWCPCRPDARRGRRPWRSLRSRWGRPSRWSRCAPSRRCRGCSSRGRRRLRQARVRRRPSGAWGPRAFRRQGAAARRMSRLRGSRSSRPRRALRSRRVTALRRGATGTPAARRTQRRGQARAALGPRSSPNAEAAPRTRRPARASARWTWRAPRQDPCILAGSRRRLPQAPPWRAQARPCSTDGWCRP